MSMAPYLAYVLVVVFLGATGLVWRGGKGARNWIGPVTIAGCSLSLLLYTVWAFFSTGMADLAAVLAGWQMPFASMSTGIDGLSAFFLIPLLVLAVACSLFGPWYFKNHDPGPFHWLFFGLLISGMVMVLLARNAILFILSWEVMSLSSFLLVITDKENQATLRAGWIYFITAHVGTAFLFGLFLLLGARSGSFDFAVWKTLQFDWRTADLLFVLALVAFGLKAGFIPFHVWLPMAHPSAPSHVSALMSGIMIKMGIYGILRILTLLAPYHGWWGGLLIGLGVVSGVLGVLFAIGQHDIKRLLAYHSVENIGIILLGLGVGITGVAYGSNLIAILGFAGALLHVLNHALFKGLLFLAAGSVLRQTGSGEIDHLGGLVKGMPKTALFFFIGSIAICGLPFFNGFVSELMIYVAGISEAVGSRAAGLSLAGLAAVAGLALIGGLASACFAKVFGTVFLGEARTKKAHVTEDVPVQMVLAMAVLAVSCIVIGMGAPAIVPILMNPVLLLARGEPGSAVSDVGSLVTVMTIVLAALAIAAIITTVAVKMFRRTRRPEGSTGTWDCGYSRPEASMQYTASSFAAPIVNYFKTPLAARSRLLSSTSLFPDERWSFHSGVNDWFLSRIYDPAVRFFDWLFASIHWFQNGKAGQYVLYIAITVFCLILWKFFL